MFVKEVRTTAVFDSWFARLHDDNAAGRIAVRIKRLALGNPGDVKPIGEGISELRIDYGPVYRIYFKDSGKEIIILLCGGDKRSQNNDIVQAKELLQNLEA